MQAYHAAVRTAVPEVIAGKRAEDTLEAFSAVQRITQFLTVDVQRRYDRQQVFPLPVWKTSATVVCSNPGAGKMRQEPEPDNCP